MTSITIIIEPDVKCLLTKLRLLCNKKDVTQFAVVKTEEGQWQLSYNDPNSLYEDE